MVGNIQVYTKGMEVGVRIGDTIKTMTCSRNPDDKYLIQNPGPEELKIKTDILNKISEAKLKSSIRASTISKQKAKVPGTIYLSGRYNKALLYVGKVKLDAYYDDVFETTKTGHLYINLESRVSKPKDKTKYTSISTEKLLDILKNKLHGTFSRTDVDSSIEFANSIKTYNEILGTISDFNPNMIINFDCKCTANNIKPYEKGKYLITK